MTSLDIDALAISRDFTQGERLGEGWARVDDCNVIMAVYHLGDEVCITDPSDTGRIFCVMSSDYYFDPPSGFPALHHLDDVPELPCPPVKIGAGDFRMEALGLKFDTWQAGDLVLVTSQADIGEVFAFMSEDYYRRCA